MSETIVKQTEAQMAAELIELRKQNAALKAGQVPDRKLSFKISTKGGCSVYGLGRFPVTLYKRQWQRLFEHLEALRAFVAAMPDDASVAQTETDIDDKAA